MFVFFTEGEDVEPKSGAEGEDAGGEQKQQRVIYRGPRRFGRGGGNRSNNPRVDGAGGDGGEGVEEGGVNNGQQRGGQRRVPRRNFRGIRGRNPGTPHRPQDFNNGVEGGEQGGEPQENGGEVGADGQRPRRIRNPRNRRNPRNAAGGKPNGEALNGVEQEPQEAGGDQPVQNATVTESSA